MKPAHLLLLFAALLLGMGLWSGLKTSSVSYKDPLDTNEFPMRFTDPIRPLSNSALSDRPLIPPPRPQGPPAIRDHWQSNSLNQAIHWLLTDGYKHYSATPFTGIARYYPHELPEGFVPSVSGFQFLELPWPDRVVPISKHEVNVRIVMTGPWADTDGTGIPFASGIHGEKLAVFHAALIGRAGMAIVDMNGTFGVFKTTNGLVTKNIGWFDP